MDDAKASALQEKYSQWRFWYGRRSDGAPGDLYATRRRNLDAAEAAAGLAMTLPYGVTGTPAEQLEIQQQIEDRLNADSTKPYRFLET